MAKNWIVGAVLLALGVGSVTAMISLLDGGDRPRASPADVASRMQRVGVRPAEVDSARRVVADPAPDVPLVLPTSRPEVEGPPEPPRRAEPVAEPPPPPMVVTDEQRAAEAAHAELRGRVAKEVGRQLDGQRSALRNACWKGGSAGADFKVEASFDAQGKLLAMGISEVRGPGTSTGDVGACLRQQTIPLSVDEPGAGVTVDVALHLP